MLIRSGELHFQEAKISMNTLERYIRENNSVYYYGEYISITLPHYFIANKVTFGSSLIAGVRFFGGIKCYYDIIYYNTREFLPYIIISEFFKYHPI